MNTRYILNASGNPSIPVLNIVLDNGRDTVTTARGVAITLAKAGYYNFDLFEDVGGELGYVDLGRIDVTVTTEATFKGA